MAVTHMFKELVVKTRERVGHAHDLEKVFGILRQHKLRLNEEKCAFGVGSGKLLRYMITI